MLPMPKPLKESYLGLDALKQFHSVDQWIAYIGDNLKNLSEWYVGTKEFSKLTAQRDADQAWDMADFELALASAESNLDRLDWPEEEPQQTDDGEIIFIQREPTTAEVSVRIFTLMEEIAWLRIASLNEEIRLGSLNIQATSKGGRLRAGDLQSKIARWQSDAEDIHKANPHWSFEQTKNEIVLRYQKDDIYKTSAGTLKRYLKNPKVFKNSS